MSVKHIIGTNVIVALVVLCCVHGVAADEPDGFWVYDYGEFVEYVDILADGQYISVFYEDRESQDFQMCLDVIDPRGNALYEKLDTGQAYACISPNMDLMFLGDREGLFAFGLNGSPIWMNTSIEYVYPVLCSNDNQTVVVGCEFESGDYGIALFDAGTGAVRWDHVLDNMISLCEISEDGSRVAVCIDNPSGGSHSYLFNETGYSILDILNDEYPAILDVSANGRCVVASFLDLWIYEVDGTLLTHQTLSCPVDAVALSHDGEYCAVGCPDGNVIVFNTNGDEVLRYACYDSIPVDWDGNIEHIVISDDGQYIAAASENLVWYFTLDGEEIGFFPYADHVTSLEISPDGQFIIFSCENGEVCYISRNISPAFFHAPVFEQNDNITLILLPGDECDFVIEAYDPDGDPLTITADLLPEGAILEEYGEYHGNYAWGFSWTPGPDQYGNYEIRFDLTDGEYIVATYCTISVPVLNQPYFIQSIDCDAHISSIEFSRDEHYFAIWDDYKTYVYSCEGDRILGEEIGITDVDFSENEQILAMCYRYNVWVEDLSQNILWSRCGPITEAEGVALQGLESVSIYNNGEYVVTAGSEGVYLFDSEGSFLWYTQLYDVLRVAFSQDGEKIIAATSGGEIDILNTSDGSQMNQIFIGDCVSDMQDSVISDGGVHVAAYDDDGTLFSVNLVDNTEWSYDVHECVSSISMAVAGQIIVTTEGGELLIFDENGVNSPCGYYLGENIYNYIYHSMISEDGNSMVTLGFRCNTGISVLYAMNYNRTINWYSLAQSPYDIAAISPSGMYTLAIDLDNQAYMFDNNLSINHSPVFACIDDKSVEEGVELTFTLSAYDRENELLSYSVSDLPPGASFDRETQLFSWTPDSTQEGEYFVHFLVTDGISTDSVVITINVIDVKTTFGNYTNCWEYEMGGCACDVQISDACEFIAVEEDTNLYLFNKTGHLQWFNEIPGGSENSFTISSDGGYLTSYNEGRIAFFDSNGLEWDAEPDKQYYEGAFFESVSLSEDGQYIAAADTGRVAYYNRYGHQWTHSGWDVDQYWDFLQISGNGMYIAAVGADESSQSMLVSLFDQNGLLWNYEIPGYEYTMGYDCSPIAITDDGQNIVVAGVDEDSNACTLFFFDNGGDLYNTLTPENECLSIVSICTDDVYGVSVDPTGGGFIYFDLDGNCLFEVPSYGYRPVFDNNIVILPVYSGNHETTLVIYDSEGWYGDIVIPDYIWDISISEDGAYIAIATYDFIALYDKSGVILGQYQNNYWGGSEVIALSYNGQYIVGGAPGSLCFFSSPVDPPVIPYATKMDSLNVPGSQLTTTESGAQQITVNTTIAMDRVTPSCDDIIVFKDGMDMVIHTAGITCQGSEFSGVITGIEIDGKTLDADIHALGTVEASFNTTLDELPEGTQIVTHISGSITEDAQSAYELAATDAGMEIVDSAYMLSVSKVNVEQTGAAVIRMDIDPAWVDANGGTETIIIVRQADDGSSEVLNTSFVGYDPESGNMIFEAYSPHGLSRLGLVAVSEMQTGNHPPILTVIENRTIAAGKNLIFTISGEDEDGDVLAYGIYDPLPTGAAFDAETQEFKWTPTQDQAGVYSLTFFVTDGEFIDEQGVNITVETPSQPGVGVILTDSNGFGLSGGEIQYYAGGWQEFGVTDENGLAVREIESGTYKFRISYAGASNDMIQEVDAASCVLFRTTNVTVQLQDSCGSPINEGTVRYYAGGWKEFATTVGGVASKELLPNSYKFRLTYGGAANDIVQDIGAEPEVLFGTTNVTVQLQDSCGSPIDEGIIKYYAGGWKEFGTTAEGVASKELLPNSYKFRLTYGGAANDIVQDIGAEPEVLFGTTNVTVQLQDSCGSPIDEGIIKYYAGGWKEFGTTSGGEVWKELLPNTYKFRMTYEGASEDLTQDVGTNPVVVFGTSNDIATVTFTDSEGRAIEGGVVTYYAGGWKEFGVTDTNGIVTKELLPGTYKFRMAYGGASADIRQEIGTPVEFHTTNVIVQLRNSEENLIDEGTVRYYAGGWKEFGTTSGGEVWKELLPNTYKFRMTYEGASEDLTQDVETNPVVVFGTSNDIATVTFTDSEGHGIEGGAVTYYASGWKEFGVTDTNGIVTKELLPGTYKFRLTYGGASTDIRQEIGTPVEFHTTNVIVQLRNSEGDLIDEGTVRYYAGGWKEFGTTSGGEVWKELLPNSYKFRMTYEGTTEDQTINICENDVVMFSMG